jgi:hypothetical protein
MRSRPMSRHWRACLPSLPQGSRLSVPRWRRRCFRQKRRRLRSCHRPPRIHRLPWTHRSWLPRTHRRLRSCHRLPRTHRLPWTRRSQHYPLRRLSRPRWSCRRRVGCFLPARQFRLHPRLKRCRRSRPYPRRSWHRHFPSRCRRWRSRCQRSTQPKLGRVKDLLLLQTESGAEPVKSC